MRRCATLLVFAMCLGCDQTAPQPEPEDVSEPETEPLPAEAAEDPLPQPPRAPETLLERASYAHGYMIGRQLAQMDPPLDMQLYVQGMDDAVEEAEPALNQDSQRQALRDWQAETRRVYLEEQQRAAARAQAEGEAFLAENGTKPGVTTTSSGLQYKIVVAGTGPKPTSRDTVRVHYRGRLLDGTEFDSTYKNEQSVTFRMEGVIRGWSEGLQLMPVGTKAVLYLPASLAYGPGGTRNIPPNSVTIFEVELLGIETP